MITRFSFLNYLCFLPLLLSINTSIIYGQISDDIKFIVDDNKLKQDHYIPGTKIKIVSKNKIGKKVDYLIVFAWNYYEEIKKKVKYAKNVISIRKFFI